MRTSPRPTFTSTTAIDAFACTTMVCCGTTLPILFEGDGHSAGPVRPEDFVNPLPHVLMLTAIVVSVAITGVALAFLVRIHREFNDLDEESLLEQVRQ